MSVGVDYVESIDKLFRVMDLSEYQWQSDGPERIEIEFFQLSGAFDVLSAIEADLTREDDWVKSVKLTMRRSKSRWGGYLYLRFPFDHLPHVDRALRRWVDET